jgi:hypothetical protein
MAARPELDLPAEQIVRLHPGQDAAHNHTGQDRRRSARQRFGLRDLIAGGEAGQPISRRYSASGIP